MIKSIKCIVKKSGTYDDSLKYNFIAKIAVDAEKWSELKRKKINPVTSIIMQIQHDIKVITDFPAYNPQVDATKRASCGIKIVTFKYYFGDDSVPFRQRRRLKGSSLIRKERSLESTSSMMRCSTCLKQH